MNERISQPGPIPEDAGETAEGQLGEPQVSVPEGFVVRKVTIYPEDTSVRESVREQFENPNHQSRIDLGDTGVGRPAASRGHKGRGNQTYD